MGAEGKFCRNSLMHLCNGDRHIIVQCKEDICPSPNSRPKLPFPGNGKGNYKMPREGKFEACIPRNHGKQEFPLTPVTYQ